MERDNFEISQELEQMREQFRILTEKVEKQNIVYEKQLRTSMRKRMNSYDFWEIWMPVIILIICYPLVYVILIKGADMPVWTAVMFTIFCILGISYLLIKKKMQDKLLDYKGDIRQFAVKVRSVKKLDIITSIVSRLIGYSVLAVFFYQFITIQSNHVREDSVLAVSLFLLIMLILGAIKDIHRFRLLDSILKEIEE